MKKHILNIALIALGLAGLSYLPVPGLDQAANIGEVAEIPPFEFKLTGETSGVGTHFEITDSEYLNVSLQSSAEIDISISSRPSVVSLAIWPASASFTQLTITGLEPNKTYYLFDNSYKNETSFNSGFVGSYTWTQAISGPHHVWLQETKGTIFIPENCNSIGTFNVANQTCTMNQDIVDENIEITQNGVTLDCDNHTRSGGRAEFGILANIRNNVTIRNCVIDNAGNGISFVFSGNSTIANNTISHTSVGINNQLSIGNKILGNTLSNNSSGIVIGSAPASVVDGNIAKLNSSVGIVVVNFRPITAPDNIIRNNVANDNRFAGIYIDGVGRQFTHILNNTVSRNGFPDIPGVAGLSGILLINTGNHEIAGNTISQNNRGVFLFQAFGNTITDNTLESNQTGLGVSTFIPSGTVNNKIFHNNFINNNAQTFILTGGPYFFDNGLPDGGNYWSDFDTPAEGCSDANNDKFCDEPYFINVTRDIKDNFPWTTLNGWPAPNRPPAIPILSQHKSDGVTVIAEEGTTTESTVVFKANLNDPDNDQVKLRVELKEFGQPFSGTDIVESAFVPSGTTAAITRFGLIDGQYHWRARAVDARGGLSGVQEFGTAGNVDFEVIPLGQASAELAKLVIDGAYLGDGETFGGKGWDSVLGEFVAADRILSGYNFWNNSGDGFIDFGAGLDCSGLVMWSYNRSFDPKTLYGFIKNENADGQFKNNSTEVAESALLPGDLLFSDFAPAGAPDGFIDHVAMYVGESDGFDVVSAIDPARGIRGVSKDILKEDPGFVAFKRASEARAGIVITANSPVDLIVTDPDGHTITHDTIIESELEFIREIPGELYYSQLAIGEDGRPITRVYSPVLKDGDYTVGVIPMSGSSPTDTYTLTVETEEAVVTIASNVSITDIPTEPYLVRASEEEIEKVIPANIRITPRSLNLSSRGVFTAFIQIERGFGATIHDIDPDTISTSGAQAVETSIDEEEDILVAKFNRQDLTDVPTGKEVELVLTGALFDGTTLEGADTIQVVDRRSVLGIFLALFSNIYERTLGVFNTSGL